MKGIIYGTTTGVIKGNTRSRDFGSHRRNGRELSTFIVDYIKVQSNWIILLKFGKPAWP